MTGKTVAYFDCFSGISGDMTLGALIDAGGDAAVLDVAIESMKLAGEVEVETRHEMRGHVGGTRVDVRVEAGQARTVPQLRSLVERSDAPKPVRSRALDAIGRLAVAEAKLHARSEDDLHLHELGGADTLVDLLGAFWLLHSLEVDTVYASPLPAPRGRSKGMPLPAPASMRVLEGTGATLRPVDGEQELVTPTGAVILATCAKFESPALSLRRIGYGIGARDTPGNALAVWIGEEARERSDVTVIETNLDDMAPNAIAALVEDLMAAGALDVTVTPVVMKKGRPGHTVSVIASPDLTAKLADHLLRDSTTLGVRLSALQRVIAQRRVVEVRTTLGAARVKVKELGGRVAGITPEYEDCRRISLESGVALDEVTRIVAEAARRELGL